MITPTSMLDWSAQWMDMAEDGFKAEMIWLASIYGLTAHPAVNNLVFDEPEWQHFASAMMPGAYPAPTVRSSHAQAYEIMQEQAIYGIGTQNPPSFPVATSSDPNLVAHKVVWSSQFGKIRPSMPDAEPILQSGVADVSDDIHAKCALALALLGIAVDHTRLDSILAAPEITPSTYHAQLCALVTKGV